MIDKFLEIKVTKTRFPEKQIGCEKVYRIHHFDTKLLTDTPISSKNPTEVHIPFGVTHKKYSKQAQIV